MIAKFLSLETLLAILRTEGIFVGVDEIMRLQIALSRLGDTADWTEMERVVACLLAKNEKERETIRAAFARWHEEAHRVVPSRRSGPSGPASPVGPPPNRTSARWPLVGGAIAAAVFIGVVYLLPPPNPVVPPNRRPDAALPLEKDAGATSPPSRPRPPTAIEVPETLRARVPRLLERPDPSHIALPYGVLAVIAAGATIWLWRRRDRRRSPKPIDPPHDEGPSRVLISSAATAPQVGLLLPTEQDQIVWGVGRHVTELPSQHLDIHRSVTETALAGGEPRLVFERHRRHHRVWTWLDTSIRNPAASQLARDLDILLSRAGLEHVLAEFSGLPDRLVGPQQMVISPAELDEGGAGTMVVIFTDGLELSYLMEQTPTRQSARSLFRELSHWPKVAVVDFGHGRVRRLLDGLDLTILDPENVPFFVQNQSEVRSSEPVTSLDLAAWMGASALGFLPQDDATLLELRRALALDVSPWHLTTLKEAAASAEREHLDWPLEPRLTALRWLVEAEDPRQPGSLLARAAAFWKERFAKEVESRALKALGWRGSRAEGRLSLAQAWVELFVNPESAIETLYRRYRGGLAEDVTAVGRHLRPLDYDRHRDTEAPLPWRLSDLSDGQLVLWLDEMGFLPRGPHPDRRVSAPGRFWIGLGLMAGLALGTLIGGVRAAISPPAVARNPEPPDVRFHWDAAGRLVASSTLTTTSFDPGTTRESLTWSLNDHYPCEDERDGVRIIRCPPTASTAPKNPVGRLGYRAYAVIEATDDPSGDVTLATAARRLIAGGHAQRVWVTKEWLAAVNSLSFDPDDPTRTDQLLVYLQTRLRARQRARLEEVARDLAVFVQGGLVYDHGSPRYPPTEAVKPTVCRAPEQRTGRKIWTCGRVAVRGPERRRAPGEKAAARRSHIVIRAASNDDTANRVASELLDQGVADRIWIGPDLERAGFPSGSATRQVIILGATDPPPHRQDEGPLAALPDTAERFRGRVHTMGWYSLEELVLERDRQGRAQIPRALAKFATDAWSQIRLVGPETCARQEVTDDYGITWVFVCGGFFTMGSNDGDENERPTRRVRVSSFWIQKYEMSNRQARTLGIDLPVRRKDLDLPVTQVSWTEASQACQRAGGRLPTEAEWEYAARGWSSSPYPWGSEPPDASRAVFGRNVNDRTPVAVDTYEYGQGPFGTHHQAGNVEEWVEDCYFEGSDLDLGPLAIDPRFTRCPPGLPSLQQGRLRTIKGGLLHDQAGALRAAARFGSEDAGRLETGFRCADADR